MLHKFLPSLTLMLLLTIAAAAQQPEAATTRLAFVQNDGPYVLEFGSSEPVLMEDTSTIEGLYVLEPGSSEPILIDATPTYEYHAVWSPDQTKLAYVVSADGEFFNNLVTLRVWDGVQSTDIVSSVKMYPAMPINWTRDGKLVYMVGEPTQAELRIEAYLVEPVAGSVPELVSNQVPARVYFGCGAPSMLPMQWASWVENGTGGKSFLQLTDYGLVYPSTCHGASSVFRPFTNEFVPFYKEALFDIQLSRDQRLVAGIAPDLQAYSMMTTLIMVNLETMEETTMTTQQHPRQLAWGTDGSLFYSTQTDAGNLLEGLTEEQISLFVNSGLAWLGPDGPAVMPRYSVGVSRLAPDGTETLVFEGLMAYEIGRMQVVGNTLYFSTISNGDTWVQAISDGTLDLRNYDLRKAAEYVQTDLYMIDLATPDSTPTLLISNATQFAAAGQ